VVVGGLCGRGGNPPPPPPKGRKKKKPNSPSWVLYLNEELRDRGMEERIRDPAAGEKGLGPMERRSAKYEERGAKGGKGRHV